jgi:hypothetical protein
MVPRDVALLASPPRPSRPELQAWTAAELRAFLAHVGADRLYSLWLLASSTGMRRGELLGIQWSDVDLSRARISVRRSLVTVGHEVVVSEPKTAKGRRSVALDPATVAGLKTWRKQQAAERLAWGPAWIDSGVVFTWEDGRPLHPREVTRAFSRHVLAAGVPIIRLHDLRHTHATLALAAGVHPKVVQERLGHANIAITWTLQPCGAGARGAGGPYRGRPGVRPVNRSEGLRIWRLRRQWRLAGIRRQWRLGARTRRHWRLARTRREWRLARTKHYVGHCSPPGCIRVAVREPRQTALGPLRPLICGIASRDGRI